MTRITFTIEMDLPRPFKNAEEARYICASIEEGIDLLWHQYMVGVDSYPHAPKNTIVRVTQTRPSHQVS